MTGPTPTGTLTGNDLQLIRTFRASIEDVWKSVTDPASTARWYGPWKWDDEAGPGHGITITMVHEEGSPASKVVVERCEEPRHLAITSAWVSIELTLEQCGEMTTMTFVHHLPDRKLVGDFGPGWEYYLDMLVDVREGRPLRKFEEYHPAQQQYFLEL